MKEQGNENKNVNDSVVSIRLSGKWTVTSQDPEGWTYESINQCLKEWGWEIVLPKSLMIRKTDGTEIKEIELIRSGETENSETVKKTPAKKVISMGEQAMENTVRDILPTLTDTEKELIKLIGDGMSVSPEIKKAIKTAGASTTAKYIKSLVQEKGLLECRENVNFPEEKHVTLFRLSAKGKIAYQMLTGDSPVEPEMDRLKRYYGTYERGYGVRACQRLFMRSKRYSDVHMSADEIKLSDGSAFRPDLVCTRYEDGKKIVEYFEYEHLRQKNTEYYGKFEKMAMITDEINIIVSSPTDHENMQRLLANWAKPKKELPDYSKKVIRLTSYLRLKNSFEENKPFHDWWYIEDSLGNIMPPLAPAEDEKPENTKE